MEKKNKKINAGNGSSQRRIKQMKLKKNLEEKLTKKKRG